MGHIQYQCGTIMIIITKETNNFVEGDNFKMKACMPAGKPDINTITHNLRMFEATVADKYKNACSNGAHTDINVISPKGR
jgi:hypothetical protein